MKAIFCIVITLLLSVACFFGAYSQGTSNKGTEFWTCYMDHIDPPTGTAPSSMILYITSDIATTGNVTLADGSFSQAFTVTANAVTFVSIPGSAFLGTGGTFLKGIHITSANPIAIYAHIYASSVSGATLLFPVNATGKTYLSLNYTQLSNAAAYSAFDVIATEDSTTVSITPSAALTTGQAANVPFTVTLSKGQVFQGLSLTDLTGSAIQSISTTTGTCKKIAVFSGSSKIGIGCSGTAASNGKGSSDNLFQQVYPTSAWGKNYITAPLSNRPYDIYRIVLSTPTANVTINGTLLTAGQFTNGLYYEFNSTTSNVISADQPVQVIQYTPTQGDGLNCAAVKNDVGDPEMIYLSPIEQGLDHVTLYSTGYYDILASYINVVIPTTAVSSFTLDGGSYTNFVPVTNNTAYSYAQIPVSSGPQAVKGGTGTVTSGTHTIKASVPFNAIAYGFGNAESYGYAAGTNLQDLNEFVQFENPLSDTVQNSGCAGVNYKLRVTIPYQTTNISWNFEDGTAPVVQNNPVVASTMIKGTQTLYTYEYPTLVNYPAGSHTVVATVFNPVADECGSYETIEYDFTITNPPTTTFTVAPITCLGDSTAFKDATVVDIGDYEKTWLWDFGDGKTSALQNPAHLYTTAGNYNVTLTVTDNNGCATISAPVSIHISTPPTANFTSSAPDCVGQNITFTDKSTSTDGTIIKWIWTLGDGTVDTLTTNAPFTHTYAATGFDTVKLTVITDKGCLSNPFRQIITIHPLPVVDFTLPDICLDDAYAQFTDKSTIADNTQASFAYLWNFGDSYSTVANNSSTLMNPKHKYSHEGNYTATLTVTSQNGCVTTKSLAFTVNGATPKAAFSVENMGALCSADSVTFDDQSTVDFGNITKLVWFFDYNNNPTDSVVYTSATMRTDKKYTHFYGLNNTTSAKTYQVQLFAYSGQTCFSPIMQNIVVNPNPVVTLSPAGPLSMCQSDQPLQITGTPNIPGTGAFSGKGISSTGLFDPSVSGTGTFTINYLFTATTTGCTFATTMQITVNPTPVVSVPATIDYLEGGQVTLDAKATITSGTMTYSWSPATGLSETDILNPVASPSNNTTYVLTVTSDKFCSASVSTTVNVLKGPVVPNTFTPNGDGVNDTWDIKYLDQYPNCTVQIVNRYGIQVYYSHNYPTPWDGRYKGADLPAGVYYYIINPGSGRKTLSGYVTLIR